MKLKYWVSANLTDSSCYNIREKTKREVNEVINEYYENYKDECTREQFIGTFYSAPFKVEVEYRNAFDLMVNCLTEGGAHWEVEPEPTRTDCTRCDGTGYLPSECREQNIGKECPHCEGIGHVNA